MKVNQQYRFLSKQLRRAITVGRTVRSFKNSLAVLNHLRTGLPLHHLHVRGGPTIDAPDTCPLLDMYEEIWNRQCYTQGDFYIRPGSIVMDIGANVGVFSLYAARIPRVRVYAFEPHPENFYFLQHNISANRAPVCSFQIAIAGERNPRHMWLTPDNGGHRLYDRVLGGRLSRRIEVQAETLADAIGRCGLSRVDFLKLDCEGAEFEILLNTSADCLKNIVSISLEFHDHVTTHTHYELVDFLERHGFAVETPQVNGTFGILQARSRDSRGTYRQKEAVAMTTSSKSPQEGQAPNYLIRPNAPRT